MGCRFLVPTTLRQNNRSRRYRVTHASVAADQPCLTRVSAPLPQQVRLFDCDSCVDASLPLPHSLNLALGSGERLESA
jgi:hypothetical protein